MASKKLDIDVIKNSFAGIIEAALQSTVSKRIDKIQSILDREHHKFFSIMADKIIGATQPPDLDGYGKDWYQLENSYTSRRAASRGVDPSQFYKNTGNLSGTLRRMNVERPFGKPVITTGIQGTYGRQKVNISDNSARIVKTGRFISLDKVKNLRYTINIDMFPRITEDTSSSNINVRKYLTGKTGYKLTNFHEGRPIVTPFVRWWLNNYMKTKIIRGV